MFLLSPTSFAVFLIFGIVPPWNAVPLIHKYQMVPPFGDLYPLSGPDCSYSILSILGNSRMEIAAPLFPFPGSHFPSTGEIARNTNSLSFIFFFSPLARDRIAVFIDECPLVSSMEVGFPFMVNADFCVFQRLTLECSVQFFFTRSTHCSGDLENVFLLFRKYASSLALFFGC